jgi:hypothetical protein
LRAAFLFPVSPSGPFFLNSSSFDFLFARLALTLGSRPQQSRLGQTGRQRLAERSALQRQSNQRRSAIVVGRGEGDAAGRR